MAGKGMDVVRVKDGVVKRIVARGVGFKGAMVHGTDARRKAQKVGEEVHVTPAGKYKVGDEYEGKEGA